MSDQGRGVHGETGVTKAKAVVVDAGVAVVLL